MKIVILGHQNPDVDSILSGYLLEKYMNKKEENTYEFVIPDTEINQETIDILNKIQIDITKYQKRTVNSEDKLFLVDHHIEKRYTNEVIGIIDHHPITEDIDGIQKTDIYYNQSSCSASAAIAEMFNIDDKEDFTLALAAALVDTASFN